MSERKLACHYCQSIFENKEDLSKHIDKIHENSGIFEGSNKELLWMEPINIEIEKFSINADEWDLSIIDPYINQSKIIAKIDGAQIIESYTDMNTRTRRFKKGSVIKTIVHPNVKIKSWNPDDELLDTTTR
jgi:hypothetical protein